MKRDEKRGKARTIEEHRGTGRNRAMKCVDQERQREGKTNRDEEK